jgi:hypothetical protein
MPYEATAPPLKTLGNTEARKASPSQTGSPPKPRASVIFAQGAAPTPVFFVVNMRRRWEAYQLTATEKPLCLHRTLASAYAEATRLCKKYPDDGDFAVFECIGRIAITSPTPVGENPLGAVLSGHDNTAFGLHAGSELTDQHHCILLGRNAQATKSHELVIRFTDGSELRLDLEGRKVDWGFDIAKWPKGILSQPSSSAPG